MKEQRAVTKRADGVETRRRLLDAAGQLFAAKGYRATKTSEICKEAEANIAALHYHFGSKEQMYVAAWQHEFQRSIALYPPDGNVPAQAPAAERLYGMIRSLVKRASDPSSHDLDIVHREMANPTGLLSAEMRRTLEPLRERHCALIRELLGPCASALDVQLCEMSIHSQCFVSIVQERRRQLCPEGEQSRRGRRLAVTEDLLVAHVHRFSIAGLEAVKRSLSECDNAPLACANNRINKMGERE